MKIQYCSDLHLEFKQNSTFLEKFPLVPSADILVLAGDITYLRKDFYEHQFLDYLSENWEKVFWVPGNHEFYCGIDINSYDFSKPIKIRENIFLVDNYSVIIEDIHFIFTSLWSKIEKENAQLIENNVSDFHLIMIDGEKLSAKSFNQLHKKSLNFIKAEIKKNKNLKKIIVTHHLPSEQCNHPEFARSRINSAFCVDLTSFIKKSNVDVWIYGHSHRNMPEISIGKTRLVTNQLGYISHNEHKSFVIDKVIEI
jgi:predicted phosphodiesterase